MRRIEEGTICHGTSLFSVWVYGRRIARLSGMTMASKILIVEDNADLSQILVLCLNDAGYETSRA
jgi:hypothetical protein